MAAQYQYTLTILRRKQVEARTGLSRSTIYERIQARTFPAQVLIGAKAVGWVESEIDSWIAAKIEKSRKAKP
jgi:prophage regulatory protein